jgi:sugar lactone lactonase YvrE
MRVQHVALGIAALAALTGCGRRSAQSAPIPADSGMQVTTIVPQPAAAIEQPPGNLTITPDGRRILSLHQYYNPVRVLAELDPQGDAVRRFAQRGEGVLPTGLVAVLGIRSDTAGVLHILDNGNSGKAPSRLLLWDTYANRLVRTIELGGVTDTNSFVNDLAFDYRRNQVYISDPAGGPNAALIVVDMATGRPRRVLQGHASMVPEPETFAVEGITPTRRKPDGTLEQPRIGVDGIGIDHAHEWVYYAPLHGRTMYRIPAAALADTSLGDSALAARIERYASKPPSDGIAIDRAGNIYLGDLPNNALGVITVDRRYHELARSPELKWVDDFAWAPDGSLHIVTTQLHRSPTLNAGRRDPQGPFRIFRITPLAPGRVGY